MLSTREMALESLPFIMNSRTAERWVSPVQNAWP